MVVAAILAIALAYMIYSIIWDSESIDSDDTNF